MRDWRSGLEWDKRTLAELGREVRIHVTCGMCRHQSGLNPVHLVGRQVWHKPWISIQYRLACSICGKKQAQLRLVSAPAMNQEPAERDRP